MGVIAKWTGTGVAGGTALGTTVGATTDTKFDAVALTGATCTVLDDFSLYGPRLELKTGASATIANWYWQAALGTGPFPQHAVRCYIEFADRPSGNAQLFSVRDGLNAQLWWLDMTAAGILRLRNNGGTAVALSKAPIPMNEQLRFEVTCNLGNVVATVSRGDTIVPLETLIGNVGTTISPLRCFFGTLNSANLLPHLYIDEMAFSNTSDFIGPNWPSRPPFTVWDGRKEIGADIYGLWDGTTLKAIEAAELAP
jgi:hypothetical protein